MLLPCLLWCLSAAQAQGKKTIPTPPQKLPSVTVNRVLFHLQGRAFTQVDLKKFLQIESTLFQQLQSSQVSRIQELPQSSRLLLFEVAGIEALSLDLSAPDEINLNLKDPNLTRELKWAAGVTYLQSKQSIFQDQGRFESWIKLVQTKYDFVSKE